MQGPENEVSSSTFSTVRQFSSDVRSGCGVCTAADAMGVIGKGDEAGWGNCGVLMDVVMVSSDSVSSPEAS